MKTILLLFIVFELTSLKEIPSLELGVNTTFNETITKMDYNQYIDTGDTVLVYIQYEGDLEAFLYCTTGGSSGEDNYNWWKVIIYPVLGAKIQCSIMFGENNNAKGNVVFYALKNGLKVKLKNKYRNHDAISYIEKYSPNFPLIYLVPNLEWDVNAIFEFNPLIELDSESYTLQNPLEVWNDNNCQKYITTYDFKKGKNYQIKVNYEKVSDYYIIPGFEIYDKNYDGQYHSDDIIVDNNNFANTLVLKYLFITLILLIL